MSTSPDSNPRRSFIKAIGGFTAAIAGAPLLVNAQVAAPARASGVKYMGDFAAPKLDKVKVVIIGVGKRGKGHASHLSKIKGVDFVGICDLDESRVRASAKGIIAKGHQPKLYFGDADAWRKILEETRPEAVFIATPWSQHVPMCIAAMKSGAHAFCEVSISTTIEDMWQ